MYIYVNLNQNIKYKKLCYWKLKDVDFKQVNMNVTNEIKIFVWLELYMKHYYILCLLFISGIFRWLRYRILTNISTILYLELFVIFIGIKVADSLYMRIYLNSGVGRWCRFLQHDRGAQQSPPAPQLHAARRVGGTSGRRAGQDLLSQVSSSGFYGICMHETPCPCIYI